MANYVQVEISSFGLFDIAQSKLLLQLNLEVTISLTELSLPAKWNLCLSLITDSSQPRKRPRVGDLKVFIRRQQVQNENKASLNICSNLYKTSTMLPSCTVHFYIYFSYVSVKTIRWNRLC